MKTLFAKKGEVERKWHLVDAKDAVLGRLATKIANYLTGKNKPIYTPNTDTGDFIVVINADKIKLTGRKLDSKVYYRHSGYPGGLEGRDSKGASCQASGKDYNSCCMGDDSKGKARKGDDKET